MPALTRPQKITFGEMRSTGVRGILIYCSDYHCSHSIAVSADQWPDDVRLSDLEARFVCKACGKRGADVRPDFNWNTSPVKVMGLQMTATALRASLKFAPIIGKLLPRLLIGLAGGLLCFSTAFFGLPVELLCERFWHSC